MDEKAFPMSVFASTLNQSATRHGGGFWAIRASAWVGLLLAVAVYPFELPRLPTDPARLMTFLAADELEAVSFIEDGANRCSVILRRGRLADIVPPNALRLVSGALRASR